MKSEEKATPSELHHISYKNKFFEYSFNCENYLGIHHFPTSFGPSSRDFGSNELGRSSRHWTKLLEAHYTSRTCGSSKSVSLSKKQGLHRANPRIGIRGIHIHRRSTSRAEEHAGYRASLFSPLHRRQQAHDAILSPSTSLRRSDAASSPTRRRLYY